MAPVQYGQELLRRRLARSNFADFIRYTFRNYTENWHHKRLADVLQGVIDGTEKRVIIEMPPRHGKSELVSRRLQPPF